MTDTIKKISKDIDNLTSEMVEPWVEVMMSEISDYLDAANQKPNSIKKNKEQTLKETREVISKWANREEERHLIEEGFLLIFQMAKQSPNGKILLEEFKQAGAILKNLISSKENIEIDTMQDLLGLSEDAMETIYQIGMDFFHNREIHKALAVFSSLVSLNMFFFNSWLMLGIAYNQVDNFSQALYAFSMASLLDLEHPLPHLYAAEIYYLDGNTELSKQTLEYALSLASEENLQKYQSEIDASQSMLLK